MISFHPGALGSFSATASELLRDVEIAPAPSTHPRKKFDIHPASVVGPDEMIGKPRFTTNQVDGYGNETGRFWEADGRLLGWTGESYNGMKRLAAAFAKSKELKGMVSERFLLDQIVQWLGETIEGKRTDAIGDFIAQRCADEISDHEIWVPLYRTFSSIDLAIGDVEFRSVTKELLDVWFARPAANPEMQERVQQVANKMRSQHQASLAACVKVRAERHQAYDVALEKANTAIGLLRFLSPANWACGIKSYGAPYGMHDSQSWASFEMDNGRISAYQVKAIDEGSRFWVIDDLRQKFPDIVGMLSDLAQAPKTEYRSTLFDALLIYSRNSLTADPANKLMFILVSLESMLLKDGGEPIQGNLAERMALLVGHTLEERKSIVASVKKTYAIRSAFVHHGQSPEDEAALDDFLGYAWACLLELLRHRGQFATRLDLLRKLDDMKLA